MYIFKLKIFWSTVSSKNGTKLSYHTIASSALSLWSCYLWFRHVDAHQVDQLADEQVEAKVLVDGVAIALEPSEEAEGEEADGEADEGHGDAHPRDDVEKKLVDAPVTLCVRHVTD